MARIRTIKPEFWLNEELAACSAYARLLAIGLLNIADDAGYFNANPALIKSAIFPFTEASLNPHGGLAEDSFTIQTVLNELSKIEYIELLKGSDDRSYGRVKKFLSHQKISHPSPSKIKGKIEFTEASRRPHGGLTEASAQERKGKEGKGMELNSCQTADAVVTIVAKTSHDEVEIFNYWKSKFNKTDQTVFDNARKTKIRGALKKYTIEQCKEAIEGCSKSQYHVENKHTTIDLIFRNSDKIEKFIEMSKNAQSNGVSFSEQLKNIDLD